MAKRLINKSKEIRDYAADHPDKTAKEIAEDLFTLKGIEVTASTVANVKSKAGLTKTKRKKKKAKTGQSNFSLDTAPTPRPVKKSVALSIDVLLDAKRFIDKAGSADAALDAIHAIQKLGVM